MIPSFRLSNLPADLERCRQLLPDTGDIFHLCDTSTSKSCYHTFQMKLLAGYLGNLLWSTLLALQFSDQMPVLAIYATVFNSCYLVLSHQSLNCFLDHCSEDCANFANLQFIICLVYHESKITSKCHRDKLSK